jgi:hypothetical protein
MRSPQPYSPGRVVLYVPHDGQGYGGNFTSPLPATIVNAWPDLPGYQEEGIVNLKVHTDALEDAWETSVHYSEGKEPRTWHWPPRI